MKKASLFYRRLKSSQQQEQRIARDLNGKRQPGSGSGLIDKGDVSTADWLIEAKQTGGVGYRLTLETLRKIELEAIRAGDKLPALVVEMSGRSYVVLRYDDFLALKD